MIVQEGWVKMTKSLIAEVSLILGILIGCLLSAWVYYARMDDATKLERMLFRGERYDITKIADKK